MEFKDITSKKELSEYLNTHRAVKDSLIGDVIAKCEILYQSNEDILKIFNEYNYFNKYEKVVRFLNDENKDGLLSSIIKDAIDNTKISQLVFLDKLFIDKEKELISRLFNQELSPSDLFDLIVVPDKTSAIRIKAIQELKKCELTPKEILLMLDSLNSVLFNVGMFLMDIWPEYLGEGYISNVSYKYSKENDKDLLRMRDFYIQEFIAHNANNLNYLFFTELIGPSDLEKLRTSKIDSIYIQWATLEFDVREAIPVSLEERDNIFFYMEMLDNLDPFVETKKAIEALKRAESSLEYECWFYVFRIKIHLTNLGFEIDASDFKKMLNEPLVAFYIKNLHDLGFLSKIPKMSEEFDWPNLDMVKRYLGKFTPDWNSQSPLTRLGYHVGHSSELTKKEREKVLGYIFEKASIQELGEDDWGITGSPTRLEKIAYHIAKLIKIFRRHRYRNMSEAINQWEEDLDILKGKYYKGEFADEFIWPSLY